MIFDEYDVIILPGGMPGAKNLKSDQGVIELIKKFYSEGKLIAAICAAPIVLQEAGIIDGKKITSYPEFKEEFKSSIYMEDSVVQDNNIITSRGPATALEFAYKIAENIENHENVIKTKISMLVNLY
jgi:protein deglycase